MVEKVGSSLGAYSRSVIKIIIIQRSSKTQLTGLSHIGWSEGRPVYKKVDGASRFLVENQGFSNWAGFFIIKPSKMEAASQHCDTVPNKKKDISDTVKIEKIFKHDCLARHPVQSSVCGTLAMLFFIPA